MTAIADRRAWLKDNYSSVLSVGIGKGDGVTFSQDSSGHTGIHRGPDYKAVVTLASRDDCPTGPRANLFLESTAGFRGPPVLFRYQAATSSESGAIEHLIYAADVGGRSHLFAVDLRTKKTTELGEGEPCSAENGAPVDRVRRRIAYCAGRVGSYRIWTIDFATGVKTDVGGLQYAHLPVGWTDDGNLLLERYAHVSKGQSEGELLEIRGNRRVSFYRSDEQINLTAPMADGVFALIENDSTVCKNSCKGTQMVLIRVRSGHAQEVLRTPRWAQPISPFDDGRSLLYSEQPGGESTPFVLAMLRPHGDEFAHQAIKVEGAFLGPAGSAVGSNALVAMVGSRLADGNRAAVYLFDPVSAQVRRVTGAYYGGQLLWTAQDTIVYRATANEIRVTDAAGQSERVVEAKNARPLAIF